MKSAAEVLDFKKKSVWGVVSFSIRTVLLNILGLVAQAVLSTMLSTSAFGIYGIVIQINALLTFFSDIGLGATLIQRTKQPTLDEYRTVFTVQQVVTWCVFLVVAVLVWMGIFTDKIGNAGNMLLLAFAISLPIGSLRTIPTLILERKLDFGKIAYAQVIEQVVYNVILIWMVFAGYGVHAYTIAVLIRTVVGVAATYYLQNWDFGFSWHAHVFKEVIGMGLKFQANDFLARIKDQLFFLVFAAFIPLEQFGMIQWAKSWSQYPYNLTVQNILQITFPMYSRLQENKQLLARAIEKSIFFISMGLFPILIGMTVFIYPLTEVFPAWEKWQPAIPSFVLFSLGVGLAGITNPLTTTLNATGRINKTLKLMIFWTGLIWTMTPLLMWPLGFGFNGVAIASFIVSLTSLILIPMFKSILPFNFWGQVWRQTIASVAMAGIGLAFLDQWAQSFEWLVAGMLVSGVVYVGVLAVLGFEVCKREIMSLLKHR